MDQWKCDIPSDLSVDNNFHQSPDLCLHSNNHLQNSLPESSQRVELDIRDCVAARKVQKADREKLRRDRINEQFLELGNALDPDRPKHEKATILTDTIQMLKDLTSQVNRLKAEYESLSEESRELTEEKNELRVEKAALKSDMDNLNAQYQQRIQVMFPWAAMDPSVVMPPPPYPFPLPLPVPPGPILMHPSLHPFPFFRNQTPGAIPSPYSTFLPHPSPVNPPIEQASSEYISPQSQPCSRSLTASKQDSRSKSTDRRQGTNVEKSDDSDDVVTELELKTPGSACPTLHSDSVPDQAMDS
ncbi:transcription factor bHLH121-like isoform X2 [Tasmannia lanceolata]|uniref:transcription factor bHLH121-like isoform X2 n=1 Tax=Tasmannia lanceolata TaxID=3420 RepID=UPI0040649D84